MYTSRKIATGLGACLLAGLGLVADASPAAAICFINETDSRLTIEIGKRRTQWRVRLNPGYRACCPKRVAACRGAKVPVTTYQFGPPPGGPKVPTSGIKAVLPWVTVRVPPGQPIMGTVRDVCGYYRIWVPRSATVRYHGAKRRWGCEVWTSQTRLARRYWIRGRDTGERTHLFACNRSRQAVIYVAYAMWAGARKKWSSTGYWKVRRGRCVKLSIPYDYYRGAAYFYGVSGTKRWSDKAAHFCINPKKLFGLTRADRRRCPRGMRKVGFFKVNLGPGARRVDFRPLN